MSSAAVVLILGSGPRVGHHVSQAFAAKGYKVAHASRSPKSETDTPNQINLQIDFSNPSSLPDLFAKVKQLLGPPSVVVYNAASATPNDPSNPFSISLEDFEKDVNINTTSAFVAAQQAVLGFQELPETAARTFIYTGNILNTSTTIANLVDLGVGKSGTAHMIHAASKAFGEKGFKFYYADQRKADGGPVYMDVDGEAHAKLYVELAEGKEQGPWSQTFVAGKGYQAF